MGTAQIRCKTIATGFDLHLEATLTDGVEHTTLTEHARVGQGLELEQLSRVAQAREGADGPAERYSLSVTIAEGTATLVVGEGDGQETHHATWQQGAICGLTTRLLLPYRIERNGSATDLVGFDLADLAPERLQARWQAVTPEGTQRLVLGSEDIADTWGFVVDTKRATLEVLTSDGLTWTREANEAAAKKDRSWPPGDPRHTVKAFLAALEAGKWDALEATVDWASLAKELEEPDTEKLRERVRAALADSHADEGVGESRLKLSEDGERRVVTADGMRFVLAGGTGSWKIVEIESK